MNFINKNEDLKSTIKSYHKYNYNYVVEYMDGSISSYYCSEAGHGENIRQRMIEQAMQRQKEENMKLLSIEKNIALLAAALSSVCTIILFSNGQLISSVLSLLAVGICLNEYKKRASKLNELKKYKIFFELMPNLDSINNSSFLKCVEFDNFYQIPFDIDTLDDYSYGEVKTIYKEYKKKIKK